MGGVLVLMKNKKVAHAVIDGFILTDRVKSIKNSAEFETNADIRLDPDAIAEVCCYLVSCDDCQSTPSTDILAHSKPASLGVDVGDRRPSCTRDLVNFCDMLKGRQRPSLQLIQ